MNQVKNDRNTIKTKAIQDRSQEDEPERVQGRITIMWLLNSYGAQGKD